MTIAWGACCYLFGLISFSSCSERQSSTTKDNLAQSTQTSKSVRLKKFYEGHESVTSGLLDKQGNLWFTTNSEGVYRFDGSHFVNFNIDEGLCTNTVFSILEDTDGNILFGTSDGLCKYDGKTFSHIPLPWGGENNLWGDVCNPGMVMSMLQDQDGNIWIGTCGGGAYRYDGTTFTNYLADKGRIQSDGCYHNWINSILEDTSGYLWFTSMTHGGISRYDGKSFIHFSMENGLSDDMILSSFQDSSGKLWFGSLGNREGGLHRYDGKAFTNFTEEDGLSSKNVRVIHEDKKGVLWITGDRDVMNIYDGEIFKPFIWNDRQFSQIRFIVNDKDGNVWFGGRSGQLYRYDWDTITDFSQKVN